MGNAREIFRARGCSTHEGFIEWVLGPVWQRLAYDMVEGELTVETSTGGRAYFDVPRLVPYDSMLSRLGSGQVAGGIRRPVDRNWIDEQVLLDWRKTCAQQHGQNLFGAPSSLGSLTQSSSALPRLGRKTNTLHSAMCGEGPRSSGNTSWQLEQAFGGRIDLGDPSKDAPVEAVAISLSYQEDEHEWLQYYNVLWVEWMDGIAYRKGSGKVCKEVWD